MRTIIIYLFLFGYITLKAQEYRKDFPSIISQDNYKKIENYRNKLIKDEKWIKYDSSLVFLTSYSFKMRKEKSDLFIQKEFIEGSFLNNIEPIYKFSQKKKDSILVFFSRIYDSLGNQLGYIDEFSMAGLLFDPSGSRFIYNAFKDYKLLYMFHIDGTNSYVNFGVTQEGKILVINASKQYSFLLSRGIYELDYYMENYWDKLFPYESDSITAEKRMYTNNINSEFKKANNIDLSSLILEKIRKRNSGRIYEEKEYEKNVKENLFILRKDTSIMDKPFWEWFCDGRYGLHWKKGTITPEDAIKYLNEDYNIPMTVNKSGKRYSILIQSVIQKKKISQLGKETLYPPYIQIIDPKHGIIKNPYKETINTFFIKKGNVR